MTSTSKKAREYLRVSIDRSGRERSQDEQHQDNATAAQRQGWRLGTAYRDTGSASRHARKRRDDYDKLIADLAADRFGASVLVLWESSRGSRKVSEWVRLIELCEQRAVAIYVTSDAKLYDCADARDRRSLIDDANDSEYEASKISKRVRRAMAASAVEGRPHGRCPYGYARRYDPVTGRLAEQVLEPAEAAVVRELFTRLHKGHSLRSVAMDFQARGVRTRTGKTFSPQHLRSLAVTHSYAGQRTHNGTVTATATWPAIVAKGVFLAVQRRLSDPDRVTTRPGRAVHLLSMIARCDVCSSAMCARTRHDVPSPAPTYVCQRATHVRVGERDLDRFAEKLMLDYLARPDNVTRLTADDGQGAKEARALVEAIRTELDELAEQVGRGLLSATLAARAEPGIRRRLLAAEALEVEVATPDVLRALISPGKDVARRWKAAPMSAKREIARLLLSPELLGELRVTRSPSRGHAVPVEERITLRSIELR